MNDDDNKELLFGKKYWFFYFIPMPIFHKITDIYIIGGLKKDSKIRKSCMQNQSYKPAIV